MKNIISYASYLPKSFVLTAFALLAMFALPVSMAIAATPGPAFNIYDNAQHTGDEHDFVRVDEAGGDAFTNSVEACDGEVDIWVYIHNGEAEEFNGDNNNGPGVAQGTRLAVNLPAGEAQLHQPSATISADNATSVMDNADITCGQHDIKLQFVNGSARGYTQQRGNFNISDAVVAGGVDIGTFADDGVVPGCWEYRIWVKLTVKIKEVEKEQPIVKCDVLEAIKIDRDTFKLKATATAKNGAKVVDYVFNFGDGDTQTVTTDALTATTAAHDYAVGTHNAKVTVNFDLDGDGQADTHKDCKTTVKVTETPTTPPVDELPNTGLAGVASGVFGTGALGMSVRSWLESRSMVRAGILRKKN
ncbi:MAG TPA: hypothetical protein VGA08_00205 [Candidatus Saccharimonadales bacterium]